MPVVVQVMFPEDPGTLADRAGQDPHKLRVCDLFLYMYRADVEKIEAPGRNLLGLTLAERDRLVARASDQMKD